MPKGGILTGKELVLNILKYAILIFIIYGIIVGIIDFILESFSLGIMTKPGEISISYTGLMFWILEWILFFVLIWFSLKRIDKLNKLFNKYTLARGLLFVISY